MLRSVATRTCGRLSSNVVIARPVSRGLRVLDSRYDLSGSASILDKEAPLSPDNSMALLGRDKEKEVPPLPPRYRLRDLIMGDYAFNDDGERSVSPSCPQNLVTIE